MPTKPKDNKKGIPKPTSKKASANPPARASAAKPPGKLTSKKITALKAKGVRASPKVAKTVEWTRDQKNKLVNGCICECAGVGPDDFASDTPLNQIGDHIAYCVHECIKGAYPHPVAVSDADNQDRIVGRM